MIDLDHFKQINDRYGHLVGDECLRWAARVIGQTLRPHNALLARFGGEEFVVALPGMDLDAAAAVAEELRQRLRDEPFRGQGQTIAVTASIGVHAVDTHMQGGVEAALQIADEALYRAKADGRDCVRTSSRRTGGLSAVQSGRPAFRAASAARRGQHHSFLHQPHGSGDFAIQRAIAVQERNVLADRRMRAGYGVARVERVGIRQLRAQAFDFGQEAARGRRYRAPDRPATFAASAAASAARRPASARR